VFTKATPLHVTLRVLDDLGSLRKLDMYQAVRLATIASARREMHFREEGAFRICHVSIQDNHLHLLVEADNQEALSRGMQGFGISAAKQINRVASKRRGKRRRGKVFADRYHAVVLQNPTQARNALAYVLNNWRKHREDRYVRANVDEYSTGVLFWGWKERENAQWLWRWREDYQPMFVYLPQTWLLSEGWKRGGGTIPFDYVPSTPRGRGLIEPN
jgi:REP element-mobilizing transposase RayT